MSALPDARPTFTPNPVRGRLNAAFFSVLDGYLNSFVTERKQALFAGLPDEVVEIGPGVGANLRYLRPGTRLIAVEPNPFMHAALVRRAEKRGVEVAIRDVVGERIDLPDASAEAVISSLLLCTVEDPAAVVGEVRRVLRPGGRYAFVEHVGARPGSRLRALQHLVHRPWAWFFEGCSCERDLAGVIRAAGFASTEIEDYTLHSPFLPANTQIAGSAFA